MPELWRQNGRIMKQDRIFVAALPHYDWDKIAAEKTKCSCPFCSAGCKTGEPCPIDKVTCDYNPEEKCEHCKGCES
jgi:hypothetical protein